MSLRDFLLVLRARWKVVFAATVLVVAAAAAALWQMTPTYSAQASFYLSTHQDPTSKTKGSSYVITTSDLQTYVAVLHSPAVQDPLHERLGLPPGTPIDVSADASGQAILTVTGRASSPQLAADIANATGPQLAAVADQFSALLAASGQQVRASTITPATAPSQPSSPSVVRDLVLALLAGLCLGLGLAFLRHSLDTKVRSDADIRALSKSPILASLPLDRAREQGVTVQQEPHGRYAEEVRRLRTNLLFVDVTTGTHSFVVTSAMPGEGKTTTAVNLAIAMAKAGGRVLLVDADLRNPSLAGMLRLEESVGLTTVLLGRATIDEVVQNWRGTDLYVLAAGQVPPNPSELLGSEPMRELFGKLSQDFDFILVDSPPLVPVIDAVLLEKLTGGMLMVVAADRTRKRDLSSALKSLETIGAHVSGFAWNKTSLSRDDARRYGYYHQSRETGAGTAEVTPPAVAGREVAAHRGRSPRRRRA